MVTVLDGHPHTLAFLAGVNGAMSAHLGVSKFGQCATSKVSTGTRTSIPVRSSVPRGPSAVLLRAVGAVDEDRSRARGRLNAH